MMQVLRSSIKLKIILEALFRSQPNVYDGAFCKNSVAKKFRRRYSTGFSICASLIGVNKHFVRRNTETIFL